MLGAADPLNNSEQGDGRDWTYTPHTYLQSGADDGVDALNSLGHTLATEPVGTSNV